MIQKKLNVYPIYMFTSYFKFQLKIDDPNDMPKDMCAISICNTMDNRLEFGKPSKEDIEKCGEQAWNGYYRETHHFGGNEIGILGENQNVINLDFDDISDYTQPNDNGGEYIGMSNEQGRLLLEFILHNYGKEFHIHCTAGKSRSQGVARFILDCGKEIAEYLACEPIEYITLENNPCETPNFHVTSLLKRLWCEKYITNM